MSSYNFIAPCLINLLLYGALSSACNIDVLLEFAVCFILALIVCRDAVGVRMETGKQALIINELRSLIESKETVEIKLKEFVGHTPLQVVMGAILGISVAIIVNLILR